MNYAKKHLNCPVTVQFKQFKNQKDPVPGLYCSKHGKLIKWLSQQDFHLIKQDLDK